MNRFTALQHASAWVKCCVAGSLRRRMLDDMVAAWRLFRDAETGFWCDSLWLSDYQDPCGADNNFYSSAGTGMGLVSEAVMVELGKISTF